jgi:hypothetical protein
LASKNDDGVFIFDLRRFSVRHFTTQMGIIHTLSFPLPLLPIKPETDIINVQKNQFANSFQMFVFPPVKFWKKHSHPITVDNNLGRETYVNK